MDNQNFDQVFHVRFGPIKGQNFIVKLTVPMSFVKSSARFYITFGFQNLCEKLNQSFDYFIKFFHKTI